MIATHIYLENLTGVTVYVALRANRRTRRLTIRVSDVVPDPKPRGCLEILAGKMADYPVEGSLAACVKDGRIGYTLKATLKTLKQVALSVGRVKLKDGPILQLERVVN